MGLNWRIVRSRVSTCHCQDAKKATPYVAVVEAGETIVAPKAGRSEPIERDWPFIAAVQHSPSSQLEDVKEVLQMLMCEKTASTIKPIDIDCAFIGLRFRHFDWHETWNNRNQLGSNNRVADLSFRKWPPDPGRSLRVVQPDSFGLIIYLCQSHDPISLVAITH